MRSLILISMLLTMALPANAKYQYVSMDGDLPIDTPASFEEDPPVLPVSPPQPSPYSTDRTMPGMVMPYASQSYSYAPAPVIAQPLMNPMPLPGVPALPVPYMYYSMPSVGPSSYLGPIVVPVR